MGKSLIVYFSLTDRTRKIFESARRPGKMDVVELRERFDRLYIVWHDYGAVESLYRPRFPCGFDEN